MNVFRSLAKKDPILYREVVVTIKVMSPLVLILLLAFYFSDFVKEAIEKDLAISGAIICTALYGTLIILQRLRSAQKDFRVIERFGKEAAAGVPMKELLEEPWISERYVRHYLKHIAETGGTLSSQLDQNAIESELHALLDDYNSKLEFPQFLVGFMIALGLLGTFIGLLQTLTGISEMLGGMSGSSESPEEQFKRLIHELRKPLAGMGIAFSASMFGLVTSLMLSIMMTNLRHFVSRVVMCARNVMHDLTQITRKSNPNIAMQSQTIATLASMELEGVEPGAGKNWQSNVLLANRMDKLLTKLDVLFKSFENSINGTTKLNELLGFGPRMKETGERTLEELRSLVASNLEQQRVLQQVSDIHVQLASSLTAVLDSQRRSHSDVMASFRNMVEKAGAIEQAGVGSGRHLWDIKEKLTGFESLSTIIESISTSISHQSILVEEMVTEARSLRDRMEGGQG